MRNFKRAVAACIVSLVCVVLMGSNIVQNVMTTLGDVIYGAINGAPTRLAGNITTSQEFLSQTGDGVNSAAPSWVAPFVAPGAAFLPGATAVSIYQTGVGIGNADLYLCPASMRCAFLSIWAFNTGVTSTAIIPLIKHAGVYNRVGTASVSIATNAASGATSGFILEAGDTIAVNSSAAGVLNIFGQVIQFSNTAALMTKYLIGCANGDNTVYTVPLGKSAVVVSNSLLPSSAINQAVTANFSSDISGRNVHFNLVPAAGTPGSTNQSSPQQTVTATLVTSTNFNFTLTAGQFVSVNVDVGNAAQIAWLNVMEF